MRIFGLDGGIASIGWAIIDLDETSGTIIAAGARCFDPPETAKERTPTNAIRRQKRGQRKVIRRRRQRMGEIRRLFGAQGLITDTHKDALRCPQIDPWLMRVKGLDHLLNNAEFAVALGHIARHRGFRSNSKRDQGANAAPDTSKMLKAIEQTRERTAQWRTVGEMFACDPDYSERRRNRALEYSRTVLRLDLEHEVRKLFNSQRALHNPHATPELESAFAKAAFSQRPLQGSEEKLGYCRFEQTEKRTAKHAPSFELFRLLSRLTSLKLTSPERVFTLSPEQIAAVMADFGTKKSITFRSVRILLNLAPSTRFADIAPEDEAKRDVAARSGSAADGSATLRDVLGDGPWHGLRHTAEKLDRIAEIITFREDPVEIEAGLNGLGIEPILVAKLMKGIEDGKFARFRGAAHISAKAARAINPHLARGLVYSEACTEAGYDHTAETSFALDDIANPVARRALGEMVKQVRAMVHEFDLPDRMHVELARDVGKSAEERDEITAGIEKINKERDKQRERYAELLHRPPHNAEELLRFALWEEQGARCLYTDDLIPVSALTATDNSVQVDHILPWSRFGDDSFINKTLCFAKANQNKRDRTPFEWFSADKPAEWAAFEQRVEHCTAMKARKRRGFYLRRNAAEVEEAFRNRNLGDTRYATRALMGLLKRMYPDDGKVHILARPGALTAKLRQAWGLEGLKKGPDGKRMPDDRHHALDALVLAATSQSMLQRLTTAFQQAERQGRRQEFKGMPEPGDGYRDQVKTVLEGVFVSRSESQRARGEAHQATIKQVRERDGKQVVFIRKPIDKLTEADLAKVKDAERNAPMIAAVRAWLEAGKPKDRLPRFPKLGNAVQQDLDAAVAAAYPADWAATNETIGEERREARRLLRRQFEAAQPAAYQQIIAHDAPAAVIRSVRIASTDKVAVGVRGGTADRGEMVRVDVFRETNKKGKARFHMVPIYPHQVADRVNYPTPPDRAVVAAKPEAEWTQITPDFEFRFSLFPNSLVEVTKPDGEVICGYFKGLHRGTAAITLAAQTSQQSQISGIGSKTLLSIEKKMVDRFGRVAAVSQETRTWHGVACT